MKREDIPFLNQLVGSFEKASEKLEEAYEKKDYDEFNRLKKFMLRIQKQISGAIK